MADLTKLYRKPFFEGDPLLPSDLNSVALSSAVFQSAATRAHTTDGDHRPPFVPVASGRVIWNPAQLLYTLGPHARVTSVVRVGQAEVRIQLARTMRAARWRMYAWTDWHAEAQQEARVPVERYGSRTANAMTIRLPLDISFTFIVFDQR